ncbi:MAG: M20 family metallopeptidase [Candidatus Bipolaricaulaceae bacterium]
MLTETEREDLVGLVRELVRIPSVNPPGGEGRIAAFVRDWLATAGVEADLLPLEPGRDSVVARLPGQGDGCYVLCGHLDTVAVDEAQWTYPPFAGQVVDGRMYGRGAADMKGGVAAILLLARHIARRKLTPAKSLLLAITCDEEGAYRGAESVAKAGLMDDAELLIITEPTGGQVYLGQKGELWVEARFTGRAAHGSCPHLGVNAVLPASRFCLELAAAAAGFPEVPGRGRTSLNIGQFSAGWRVNVVPDVATVRLDLRVVTEEERERVLDLIANLGESAARAAGAEFSQRTFNWKPPIITSADHPSVRKFLAAAGAEPGAQTVAPYSTDAVAVVPYVDVPVVIYGPGSIAQAHQPDEYIELSSLEAAYRTLSRFALGEAEGQ